MTNKAMSPNHREALTAESSINGLNEYVYSTSHALDVNVVAGGGSGTQYTEGVTTSPGVGNLSLGRYSSTPPSLTNGQMSALQVDTSGNLLVSGSLSVGGTTDNSAFTAGTSTGTPAMGFYHSTIDTVTDGRAAAVGITSKRALLVNLQTAAGAETGIAGLPLQVSLANTATNGTAVTIAGIVTANAGTNLNTSALALAATQTDKSQFTKLTDGTDTALITAAGEQNVIATAQPGVDIGDVTINNAAGAAAVNIQDGGNTITVDGTVSITANSSVNIAQVNGQTINVGTGAAGTGTQRVTTSTDSTIGTVTTVTTLTGTTSLTPGTAAANLGKAEDAQHASGDVGVMSLAVRNDNAATTFGANADYYPTSVDLGGRQIMTQKAATGTVTSVADTNSSTTLLAANSARLGAIIYNDSTVTLYVKYGATATTSDYTVLMVAQAYHEVPFGYTGILDGIWASNASGAAKITEMS